MVKSYTSRMLLSRPAVACRALPALFLAGTSSLAAPATAQTMPGMTMPAPPAEKDTMPSQPKAEPDDNMAGMAMEHGSHAMGAMTMTGAFGPYAMTREASGTSWQPDVSPHMGVHVMRGDWMLMGHGLLNLVDDAQSGRRGDDRAFVSGMVMGMATGALSPRDTVQFRAMLSPDPLMGKRGYPLLLAAGETADGVTPLVDRQHPHDLFMELAASYSRRIGDRGSAFVYFGLPGEPAFGPPAFMHRLSIIDSPEAPITHHWLDSTHITYGVVTAGATYGGFKIEASRFKGREPDQYRWDIEAPKFDSTAVRVSVNPTHQIALQVSYARQKSAEQLEPGTDQDKWSASAIWTRPIGADGYFAATAAWGRKQNIAGGVRERPQDAFFLEATLKPTAAWTIFGRGEVIESDELLAAPGGVHGSVRTVGKASIGAIRDFPLGSDLRLGFGALVARSVTPAALDIAYGGDRTSGMAFVRLKLG